MKNRMSAFIVFLIAAFCLTNPAFATTNQPKPKAKQHVTSKQHATGKRHLVGGTGSSHKGGHYVKG